MNAWDEPAERVRKFAADEKLPYTVLMNGRSVYKSSYEGRGIPCNILLDKDGTVVKKVLGFSDADMEAIDKKIAELTS